MVSRGNLVHSGIHFSHHIYRRSLRAVHGSQIDLTNGNDIPDGNDFSDMNAILDRGDLTGLNDISDRNDLTGVYHIPDEHDPVKLDNEIIGIMQGQNYSCPKCLHFKKC